MKFCKAYLKGPFEEIYVTRPLFNHTGGRDKQADDSHPRATPKTHRAEPRARSAPVLHIFHVGVNLLLCQVPIPRVVQDVFLETLFLTDPSDMHNVTA